MPFSSMPELVLYVTYDGLMDPLGDSQVLRYLERIDRSSFTFFIVSFEKQSRLADKSHYQLIDSRVRSISGVWFPLKYGNRFSLLSYLMCMFNGIICTFNLIGKFNIRVCHARSYMPAFMLLPSVFIFPIKLVFDPRSFWPEEKVDANQWRNGGLIFLLVKFLESIVYKFSSIIILQTQAAVDLLESSREVCPSKLVKIPNSVDLDIFLKRPVRSTGFISLQKPFVLGYTGSFGTWYMLDEMLLAFGFVSKFVDECLFSVVTNADPALIINRASHLCVNSRNILIAEAKPWSVPKYVQEFDLGLAFIKPCFSKLAASPTKIPEYLSLGVPVLSNTGIGDLSSQIEDEGVGVLARSFEVSELERSAYSAVSLSLTEGIAKRCRAVAEKYFDVSLASLSYSRIYSACLKRDIDQSHGDGAFSGS
jgi:glycosyltransferase involved in cell wall biosynthesis